MTPVFAALLIALTPPPAGVELSDAEMFPVDGPSARVLWVQSRNHKEQMQYVVMTNNPPEVVAEWLADWDWRHRVWFLVDDIKFCHWSDQKKLQCLAELRSLLGEQCYRRGILPLPCPRYRGLTHD